MAARVLQIDSQAPSVTATAGGGVDRPPLTAPALSATKNTFGLAALGTQTWSHGVHAAIGAEGGSGDAAVMAASANGFAVLDEINEQNASDLAEVMDV